MKTQALMEIAVHNSHSRAKSTKKFQVGDEKIIPKCTEDLLRRYSKVIHLLYFLNMIFAFRHRVQSGSNHMLSYSTLYNIDSWLGILKSDLKKKHSYKSEILHIY